ncbi:MAG: sugar phosphate isomerase/epimerase [Chloroflexi bacterium]|nr:MAG: sugar phosphate isomerase/epimerase [Chloroflexota bacterium]
MKIGLFTDSLAELNLEQALDWCVSQGIEAVEIGTGNFSSAPHCDLDALVDDKQARERFLGAIQARGLSLSALNCNGNPLDPDSERGTKSKDILNKTLEAANRLELDTVVTMSGCPGDLGGGRYPNWVTCTWQPEYVELVERQWDEVIAPFWEGVASKARELGVRIAIEMHPGQAAYNTRSLQRLREIGGKDVIGANLDPSHLFYQGMEPDVVVRALGPGAVFHVHAKDTRLNPHEIALNGTLDIRPMTKAGERTWEYVTLGFGHGESFWRNFLSTLRIMDYDGVLSIEHEDLLMSPHEGIEKSVSFLQGLTPRTTPDRSLEGSIGAPKV